MYQGVYIKDGYIIVHNKYNRASKYIVVDNKVRIWGIEIFIARLIIILMAVAGMILTYKIDVPNGTKLIGITIMLTIMLFGIYIDKAANDAVQPIIDHYLVRDYDWLNAHCNFDYKSFDKHYKELNESYSRRN